jgi:hypothetical protein
VGRVDWAQSCCLWYLHNASDKRDVDYCQTKNLRAGQLLLGHTKLESRLRYLGIEVDDALEIAKSTEVWSKENGILEASAFVLWQANGLAITR